MIILIILIIVFVLGYIILNKVYGYDLLGFVICLTSGIYIILHVILWAIASYNYNIFLTDRTAFVETLANARESGNQIELAAITRNVSEWNENLAEMKYNSTIFLLRDYVDQRVKFLQPIK